MVREVSGASKQEIVKLSHLLLLMSNDTPAVAATEYNVVSGGNYHNNAAEEVPSWRALASDVDNQFAPFAITVKAAYATVAVAPGVGASWILTLYANGGATLVTITISGLNVAGTWTGNRQIIADSFLYWKCVPAVNPAPSRISLALLYEVT